MAYAVQNGIPVPTFSAAIVACYALRAASEPDPVLPAITVQARRDTSVRIPISTDKEGVFTPNGWMSG